MSSYIFLAGYSQWHPLSVFIYIIAVDPFLHRASSIVGASSVWGFCDDWKIDIDADSSLEPIVVAIAEFEIVSG
jgi:hypothetical protein